MIVSFEVYSQFSTSLSVEMWVNIDNEFIKQSVTSELTHKIENNLKLDVIPNNSIGSNFTIMIVSVGPALRTWTVTCIYNENDSETQTKSIISNDLEYSLKMIYRFIENFILHHQLNTRYVTQYMHIFTHIPG